METHVAPSIALTIAIGRCTSSPMKDGIVITYITLEGKPVLLDGSQRHAVARAIRETCTFRKWHLHAVSVRTNHVHVVTAIGLITPERALSAFKANATRQMRQDGCWR